MGAGAVQHVGRPCRQRKTCVDIVKRMLTWSWIVQSARRVLKPVMHSGNTNVPQAVVNPFSNNIVYRGSGRCPGLHDHCGWGRPHCLHEIHLFQLWQTTSWPARYEEALWNTFGYNTHLWNVPKSLQNQKCPEATLLSISQTLKFFVTLYMSRGVIPEKYISK